MNRRSFVASGITAAAGSSLLGPAFSQTESEGPYYELMIYKSQIGEPFGRLDSWAKEILVPSMKKVGVEALGCFSLALGVQTPELLIVMEHSSISEMQARWQGVRKLPEWGEGLKKLEAGELPPYESIEKRLLRATPYAPALSEAVGRSKEARFFEFRLYHSPTFRQLKALHERFSGPEIKIFHRVGIHPILYGDTVFGTQVPCLTYMMPFESLAAREMAWNKFRADPEWIQVRADSIARAGEIVTRTDRFIYRATPYSPIL